MAHDGCAQCGFDDWIPIGYGYPSDEAIEAMNRGEIALGGCIVDEALPRRRCRFCGLDEGSRPTWNAMAGPIGEFDYFYAPLTVQLMDEMTSVSSFALSFDGYAAFGFDKSAELAKKVENEYAATGTLPDHLVALRNALFFHQRGCHHRGDSMAGAYVDALLEAIRRAMSTACSWQAASRQESGLDAQSTGFDEDVELEVESDDLRDLPIGILRAVARNAGVDPTRKSASVIIAEIEEAERRTNPNP